MARVYARRLIPYLLVIILFILLSWFFSFQLEEDAAQKRQISYLRNRVAELKSKVREYEQDETPRESKQGAYSFAEAESRRFYDKPQLGANHGIVSIAGNVFYNWYVSLKLYIHSYIN